MNEPRTNCHSCWFAWLNSHGTLTQAVEEAFQKQGADFVIKMRGQKFLKMFLKFMSTVAAMQATAQKEAEEKNAGNDVEGTIHDVPVVASGCDS